MDYYDVTYLLNLFELISYNEYTEEMLHKDTAIKQSNQETKSKSLKGFPMKY